MRPTAPEPKSRYDQAEADRRAQQAESAAAEDKAWTEQEAEGMRADGAGHDY